MRVQRAEQAQEILGHSDVGMLTERVDDGARLIGQMVTMGLPEVLDRPLPRPWRQRSINWGWTAVIWWASLLTEGDHRTVAVATSRTGMHPTLSRLPAQVLAPLDLRDDRLSHRLKPWSKPASWHPIEQELHARSMEVDPLPQNVIRGEATTVSGEHEVTAGGLWQFGQSQEDPTRPPITVMRGSLEPLGMPRATEVLSGERAADGVYLPIIERMRNGLQRPGLWCVGDGTRRALDTRTYLARPPDGYLSPLPLTGATAEAMEAWSPTGVRKGEAGEWARLWRPNDRGHAGLAAEGEECARTWGAPDGDGAWSERGVVGRSPMHATHQAAGLAKRLRQAETPLTALTPPRGRGKRHITDEATLGEAMALVLTAHRVEGLLSVVGEKQVAQTTQDVGRGRGSLRREKRVIQTPRDHIPHSARQEAPLAARRQRLGWKAFVTKAGPTRLSWQDAVLGDRHAYRVERLFQRLKSRVHSAPLFVKLQEHMEGLTSLLTLGGRVWTVTACVLRRSLETAQARLPGWHPENKHKRTDMPTAARILQACAEVSLTIIHHASGEDILRRLTPLSGVQEAILQRLGVGTHLYRQLEMQNMESW